LFEKNQQQQQQQQRAAAAASGGSSSSGHHYIIIAPVPGASDEISHMMVAGGRGHAVADDSTIKWVC